MLVHYFMMTRVYQRLWSQGVGDQSCASGVNLFGGVEKVRLG